MNNNFKQQLQEKEFKVLKDKRKIALRWATGCGKSKMVIDLLDYAANDYQNGTSMSVLFVVAERAHIQNWKEEFVKWNLHHRTKVTIVCYASLHKLENESYDAIVFDEAHHAFTEKRMAIIRTLSSDYVYLLSATLPPMRIEEMEEIYGKFTTSTVTLKEAISKDILPDPRIYVIELALDNTTANQEISVGKPSKDSIVVEWKDKDRYIFKNIPCTIVCTEKQKYDFYIANVENHVLCLTKAFEITSKEIGRSPLAVANHWYSKTSTNGGKTLFGLVSGTYLVVNRKNARVNKAKKMPAGIFQRILKLLKLKG